ncbi:hypothetical protein PR003_g30400 [Phytophthora rubi]|uniref:Uncharacterized protein n=1 Tax=Phytophthora rubi TaxID=129364 RepID=A0A6A4BFZ1_9STRA|nr:hypothetical protein PR002_g29270 [Phytophthora rubi]KAE8963817.1 hypothetical protein PR001_g29254 [Phytophthora rubi]KAE9271807.1 hypothetical protein PR003_g30400 [Phytophthora rubi]
MAPKTNKTSKKTNNVTGMDDLQEPVLAACDPLEPVMPAFAIPKKVIAAMVAAGAEMEDVEGEDLRILRIDGVHLDAWNVYEDWASSLGEVDPLVQAYFVPPLAIRRTSICPPNALGVDIQDEANSVINHFAPLLMDDVAAGIPALLANLANLAPLPAPAAPTNIHNARVAVAAVLRAICCPGPNFPVINGLHVGHYICHVQYVWSGAVVTMPVFRM